MQDSISNLPTDESLISPKEAQLIKQFFPETSTGLLPMLSNKTYLYVFKEAIIGAILFAILSHPKAKEYIIRFFPSAEKSQLFMTGSLMAVFIILFFFIDNFYSIRKN